MNAFDGWQAGIVTRNPVWSAKTPPTRNFSHVTMQSLTVEEVQREYDLSIEDRHPRGPEVRG